MNVISSKSLYFATPLAFNVPDGGFPSDDLVKFCTVVRGWLSYTAAKKYCQKLQPPEYRAHHRCQKRGWGPGPLTFYLKGPNMTVAPTFWKTAAAVISYNKFTNFFQAITITITNLLLNSIQTREAHKINQTLAVADTPVSSDVSSM